MRLIRPLAAAALAFVCVLLAAASLQASPADPSYIPPPNAPSIAEDKAADEPVAASDEVYRASAADAANQAFAALQRIMDDNPLEEPADSSNGATASAGQGPTTIQMLGRMLMSLGIVIAVGLGVALLAKRFVANKAFMGGGRIELLSSFSISPKSKLHVVRVGGEQFLIGESGNGVQLISALDPNEEYEIAPAEASQPKVQDAGRPARDVTPFQDRLAEWSRALEGRNGGDLRSSLSMLKGLSAKLGGKGGAGHG